MADPSTDRFDVRPASEVYLASGRFSVQHMTSVLSDNLEQVVAGGSGVLRATGEMPWPGVLLQPHGVDDFFEYEAALNDVVDQKPALFMCLDRTVLDNPHFLSRAEYDAESARPTSRPPLGTVSADRPDPWRSLTPSETRIAGLVATGLINRDIAQHLSVSHHTVEAHLKHICTKLGVHSRVELTVLAMQHRSSR